MTDMPRGRCGNDPRTVLSPGDQVAVDEFREYLLARRTIKRVMALRDQWQGRDLKASGQQLLAELTAALAGTPAAEASARPAAKIRIINVTAHIEGYHWWCGGCPATSSKPFRSEFGAYQDANRDHPHCGITLTPAQERTPITEQAPHA